MKVLQERLGIWAAGITLARHCRLSTKLGLLVLVLLLPLVLLVLWLENRHGSGPWSAALAVGVGLSLVVAVGMIVAGPLARRVRPRRRDQAPDAPPEPERAPPPEP